MESAAQDQSDNSHTPFATTQTGDIKSGGFVKESCSDRRIQEDVNMSDDTAVQLARHSWWAHLQSVPLLQEDILYFVLNYFTVMGYNESALRLAEDSGVTPELPLAIFTLRQRVADAILEGRLDEAVDSLQETEPQILKNNPNIYFKLRQEQLLKIIKEKNDRKALSFAQTYLAPCVKDHPYLLPKLEDIMARLAFPDLNTETSESVEDQKKLNSTMAKEVGDAVLDYFSIAKDSALDYVFRHIVRTQHELLLPAWNRPTPFMVNPSYGGLWLMTPLADNSNCFNFTSSPSSSSSSDSQEAYSSEHSESDDPEVLRAEDHDDGADFRLAFEDLHDRSTSARNQSAFTQRSSRSRCRSF